MDTRTRLPGEARACLAGPLSWGLSCAQLKSAGSSSGCRKGLAGRKAGRVLRSCWLSRCGWLELAAATMTCTAPLSRETLGSPGATAAAAAWRHQAHAWHTACSQRGAAGGTWGHSGCRLLMSGGWLMPGSACTCTPGPHSAHSAARAALLPASCTRAPLARERLVRSARSGAPACSTSPVGWPFSLRKSSICARSVARLLRDEAHAGREAVPDLRLRLPRHRGRLPHSGTGAPPWQPLRSGQGL